MEHPLRDEIRRSIITRDLSKFKPRNATTTELMAIYYGSLSKCFLFNRIETLYLNYKLVMMVEWTGR